MIASSISWIICSQLLLQDGRINYEEFAAMMRKGNPELAPNRRRKWAWYISLSSGFNFWINYLLIYLCCCITADIHVWPQLRHLLTTKTALWNLLFSPILCHCGYFEIIFLFCIWYISLPVRVLIMRCFLLSLGTFLYTHFIFTQYFFPPVVLELPLLVIPISSINEERIGKWCFFSFTGKLCSHRILLLHCIAELSNLRVMASCSCVLWPVLIYNLFLYRFCS